MKFLACCFITLFVCQSYAQTITMIAGIDSAGYSGDGMAATASALNRPFSIAVNNSGNVYVADRYNSRIRKINSTGVISTIAGTGIVGYSGDGGVATLAKIGWPTGVAADVSGNVYFADKGNNVIRKIDATGIISTFAGNGSAGNGGDGGPSTAGKLNQPNGVAVDISGNVYIADQANNVIRKVNPAGVISTVAGMGTSGYNGDNIAATAAQLQNPYAVAVDRSGNIYIADVDNERIRKVDPSGIITTITGTGAAGNSGEGSPATTAELFEPIGVAVDSAGNVYISDAWNSRICVVNTLGALNSIAGRGVIGFSGDGGTANMAELNSPYGVAIDRTGIYVADYANSRIRYITYSATGVAAVNHASSLKISPNPSTGTLLLTLSSDITEPARITLTNCAGQTVFDCSTTTNQSVRIKTCQPAGLYVISVVTSGGICTEKVELVGK